MFMESFRLNPCHLGKLKEAFMKSQHPRFKKEFAPIRHQPFGKQSDYVVSLQNADLTKITKLIRLAGLLLQTKVYLFYEN